MPDYRQEIVRQVTDWLEQNHEDRQQYETGFSGTLELVSAAYAAVLPADFVPSFVRRFPEVLRLPPPAFSAGSLAAEIATAIREDTLHEVLDWVDARAFTSQAEQV